MRRLVLGVVGHVDHGKTALVRALTGTNTDRLAEEKARGISISLGFAHLVAPGGQVIDLIDMPGHERFVRTMIGGAGGLDAILVVVAANEGVMPQTEEHIGIAGLLGVRRAIVAVSKTDLAQADRANAVGRAALALAQRAGMETVGPVRTSAPLGEGLGALTAAIAEAGRDMPARSSDGFAYLPIDRAFGVVGHGPVVTGTLRGAPVAEDDVLDLAPLGRAVRIKAVQVNGKRIARADPGQRVAVNLRDVQVGELRRGMSLAARGALAPSHWLSVTIRALQTCPPLRTGTRLRALFGTAEGDAVLRLLDRDELAPGESGFAQLHLADAVMLPAGEHVVLRRPSPPCTLAGGRILDPVTWRQRRNRPAVLDRLRDLATLAPCDMIAAELERAGMAGLPIASLSRVAALPTAGVRRIMQGLPVVEAGPDVVVLRHALSRLADRIATLLEGSSAPLTREGILTGLPGVSGAVLDCALAGLVEDGTAIRRRGSFEFCRPDEQRAQRREEDALALRLAQRVRAGGLTPDLPQDILDLPMGLQILNRLVHEGVLVRTKDSAKQRGVVFHSAAVEQAKHRLTDLLSHSIEGLRVGEIGPALGLTRKFSVPLLSYLDEVGFTRRLGDRRVLHRRTATPGSRDTDCEPQDVADTLGPAENP